MKKSNSKEIAFIVDRLFDIEFENSDLSLDIIFQLFWKRKWIYIFLHQIHNFKRKIELF